MEKHHRERLSKILLYILRHRPDEYGLVLDPQGYVPVKELVQALHEEAEWSFVRKDHLQEVILTSDRGRFEMDDRLIRAVEGLSEPISNQYERAEPPKILYYGARRRAYPVILDRGLQPAGRPFVSLAAIQELALRMGRRRDPDPVLLEIQALKAHREGIPFYRNHELLFLVENLPSQYLVGPPLSKIKLEVPRKEEKTEIPPAPLLGQDLGLQSFLPPRRKGDKLPEWKREVRRWRRREGKGSP